MLLPLGAAPRRNSATGLRARDGSTTTTGNASSQPRTLVAPSSAVSTTATTTQPFRALAQRPSLSVSNGGGLGIGVGVLANNTSTGATAATSATGMRPPISPMHALGFGAVCGFFV